MGILRQNFFSSVKITNVVAWNFVCYTEFNIYRNIYFLTKCTDYVIETKHS